MTIHTKARGEKESPRTKRVQTVLTTEQYELLLQAAHQAGKTVSALVREAIEVGLLAQEARRRSERAFKKLVSLDAPVSDWKRMESEIIAGAQGE